MANQTQRHVTHLQSSRTWDTGPMTHQVRGAALYPRTGQRVIMHFNPAGSRIGRSQKQEPLRCEIPPFSASRGPGFQESE